MCNMISLAALDKFATDHSLLKAKCANIPKPICFSKPPTDAEVSVAIAKIRTLVLEGCVDQAVDIVNFLCPDAVNDPELQIEIRIHSLFELIHRTRVALKEDPAAYQKAVQRALEFSKDLANFALHAFPDAYARFTQSMMLFAYPDQDVSDSKLMERRDILAGNLANLVRMTVGTRDSSLSLLIRYLLIIYLQFDSTSKDTIGNDEKIIHDLLPRRKSDEDHPGGLSWDVDDTSFLKNKSVEDHSIADIQSLRERLNISRNQSVLSLHFAKGDTLVALRNELGRLKFNSVLFEHLVSDYRAARGLDALDISPTKPGDRTEILANFSSIDESENLSSSSVSCSSLRMSRCMRKLRALAKQAGSFDVLNVESIRQLLPKTSSRLNFRLLLRENLYLLYADKAEQSIHNCRDKMGPLVQECQELMPLLSDVLLLAVYARDCQRIRTTSDTGKYGTGSDLFTDPVDETDEEKAVHDQRKSTASDYPGFESAIVDAHSRVSQHAAIDGILGDAYELLEKEFGEPLLVKLLKRLLAVHNEWQSRNLMQDRFSDRLGIDELRFGLQEGPSRSHLEVDTQITLESKGIETRSNEHAPVTQNEDTILALMEFLAMTRAEALSAVRNHPLANDPQAMVNYVLGSMM